MKAMVTMAAMTAIIVLVFKEFGSNRAWSFGPVFHDLSPVFFVRNLKKGAFSKKHDHSVPVLLASDGLGEFSHELAIAGHLGHFLPDIGLGQSVELHGLHSPCLLVPLQVEREPCLRCLHRRNEAGFRLLPDDPFPLSELIVLVKSGHSEMFVDSEFLQDFHQLWHPVHLPF